MRQEHPTLDGATFFRCMLVAFDEDAANACTRAVSPLVALRFDDVSEACAKMSEVLPLIVLHPDGATPIAELIDLAEACGAEVLSVSLPVETLALGRRIREALTKAEARRASR